MTNFDSELSTEPGRSRLVGRVAIVSGGGSSGPGLGNGRATCIVLAREGASVVVVDRNAGSAKDTVSRIEAEGGVASAFTADATRAGDCAAAVATAIDRHGAVDILINSIGIIGPPSSVLDVSEADWDMLMSVNVKPVLMMSKHAIPHMKPGSAIVNVSSIAGIRVTERVAYAASKAAVIGMTTTMAGQHGQAGIRVNSVCPGAMWTPIAIAQATSDDQLATMRENRRQSNLLKTEGTGWDVAYATLFLVSRESRWITGQTLVVDGGMCRSSRTPAITAAGTAISATVETWRW